MRTRAAVALLVVGLVLVVWGGVAQAIPVTDWSIAALPDTGVVEGLPGATIGWGYTIANLSDALWLVLAGASPDPVLHGSPDVSVFDYPILAPLETRSASFDGTTGLFQLTWDVDAPAGFSTSGTVLASAWWYDGDPLSLSGGNFVDFGPDHAAPYVASVASAAVPEPSIALLLISGLVGLGLFVGRRATGSLAG